MRHIAVGGFQHETNTFAPHLAPYVEFERADSWPGLVRGETIFPTMDGLNLPLAGFIEAARARYRLSPMLWCSAEPSSYVTRDAYERVTDELCDRLQQLQDLDAIYLDLHGAMVAEHFEDGEGELLRRVRAVVGPELPLVISLDLHANVTDAMLEHCDAMSIFRTYPHLDMAAAGARALDLLEPMFSGPKPYKTLRKIPFLIPLTAQCTDFDPCKTIYQAVTEASDRNGMSNVDFATGFPPADIHECGAAFVAYGDNEAAVEAVADELYQQVAEAEAEFEFAMLEPDEAVRRAMQNAESSPVVLADAQDNPGAGGTSDSTGLLAALVRNGARRAVVAVMYDPEVAAMAHEQGVGAVLHLGLGGKSGAAGTEPYHAGFEVEAVGDGRFIFTGEMNRNAHAELGDMALLRVIDDEAEVRVVVASSRAQCLDQAMIRCLGIDPAEQNIVAVKSTVHFRADFDPIASQTLVVRAPGSHPCKLTELKYKNLRAGVRLEPLGPVHPG